MNKFTIERPVDVTAVKFDRNFDTIPARIEFEGHSYTFIDSGIRYLIHHGERITRLFDMSDGEVKYRLRQESGATTWQLVTISR